VEDEIVIQWLHSEVFFVNPLVSAGNKKLHIPGLIFRNSREGFINRLF
jgi:hypothetical protein